MQPLASLKCSTVCLRHRTFLPHTHRRRVEGRRRRHAQAHRPHALASLIKAPTLAPHTAHSLDGAMPPHNSANEPSMRTFRNCGTSQMPPQYTCPRPAGCHTRMCGRGPWYAQDLSWHGTAAAAYEACAIAWHAGAVRAALDEASEVCPIGATGVV